MQVGSLVRQRDDITHSLYGYGIVLDKTERQAVVTWPSNKFGALNRCLRMVHDVETIRPVMS